MTEPIIVLDKDLKVRYANNVISSGLTDYVGLHINEFISDGFADYFKGAMLSGVTHVESDVQVELVAGQMFDLELICIPFYVDGEIDGALLTLNNITHIKQMQRSQIEAESASKAKSDFLSKMSHEMRTPMNAILGMTELILSENISDKTRIRADAIKQSGGYLLELVNGILDISKIESGMLEIVNEEYSFYSEISEVIDIIRIRNRNSGVLFAVYVQSDIPNHLYGDALRIRQVLLNILTNALKYTKEGHFTLDVTGEMIDNDTISFTIKIRDTGIGIKSEDIPRLFGEFSRIDSDVNHKIEGTGLGLAITKNLLDLMGGTISVTSEHGKGSEFTITLPQKIRGVDSITNLQNVENKSVLLYGENSINLEYVEKTLSDLNIFCLAVSDENELYTSLTSRKWSYVLAEETLVYDAIEIIRASKLDTNVVMMTDLDNEESGRDFSVLPMPAYVLSIMTLLLDGEELFSPVESDNLKEKNFTAKTARILVVDDIEINLMVAEGMLETYCDNIDTVDSGRDAIRAVMENDYDIVFMDQMMPGMDGVETVSIIRKLDGDKYAKLPIVALTANAIVGVKEMFLQNGFNDFISKPIEAESLNKVLFRWLPDEKITII